MDPETMWPIFIESRDAVYCPPFDGDEVHGALCSWLWHSNEALWERAVLGKAYRNPRPFREAFLKATRRDG